MAAATCAAPCGVYAAAGASHRSLRNRDGASFRARVASRVRSRGSVTVRAAITDPPSKVTPPTVQGPAVTLPQIPIHSTAGDIMDVFPEDMILEPGELGTVSRGVMRAEDAERLNWYLRAILTANVYDVAVESPLEAAPKITEKYGVKIHLKREDLQPVFSFKLRGAYNRMAQISEEALAKGVICSSAGNHAQGVALAAKQLGCDAVICMPVTTPGIKVEAVRRLGATVALEGENYDACQA